MYGLRNSIESLVNKPEIEVGIDLFAPYIPKEDPKEKYTKLSTHADFLVPALNQFLINVKDHPEILRLGFAELKNYFAPVRIVVKNSGKRALRFYKITLTIRSFPGNRLPVIGIDHFKLTPDGKVIFFNGGAENIIYPGDAEEYQLYLVPDEATMGSFYREQYVSHNEKPDIGGLFAPGKYEFFCTVWGEGMDGPKRQILTLNIRNDLESLNAAALPFLAEEPVSVYGTSAYGFETDADRARKKAESAELARIQKEISEKRSLEVDSCADSITQLLQTIFLDFITSYKLDGYEFTREGQRSWAIEKIGQYGKRIFCKLELIEDPEPCLECTFHSVNSSGPSDNEEDDPKYHVEKEALDKLIEVLSAQTNLKVQKGIYRRRSWV